MYLCVHECVMGMRCVQRSDDNFLWLVCSSHIVRHGLSCFCVLCLQGSLAVICAFCCHNFPSLEWGCYDFRCASSHPALLFLNEKKIAMWVPEPELRLSGRLAGQTSTHRESSSWSTFLRNSFSKQNALGKQLLFLHLLILKFI